MLDAAWEPGFGSVVTWFAVDKNGKVAVMINNCFGDLPKSILCLDNIECTLDCMSEFIWEESEELFDYPMDRGGVLQVDLFSAWRYRNSPVLIDVVKQLEADFLESGVYSEANLSVNKGLFVYHGVEGDNPGVDYPVGYSGLTSMGDYFRYLVPTKFASVEDFPPSLRGGFAVSNCLDFSVGRIFKGEGISKLFPFSYSG